MSKTSRVSAKKRVELWYLENGERWLTESYTQIAKEIQCSPSVIYRELPRIVAESKDIRPSVVRDQKRAHRAPLKTAIPPHISYSAMEKHYQGMHLDDIAWELGISSDSVRRIIKRAKGKK